MDLSDNRPYEAACGWQNFGGSMTEANRLFTDKNSPRELKLVL